MQEGRPDNDETLVFNPISQHRYALERLVTSFAFAVAIVALAQLGPHRYRFACVLILVQTLSTLYVQRRPALRENELGIFLVIDLFIANMAPFLLDSTWAPAVVVTMYSLGVNAPRLSRSWVLCLTGGSVLAFGLSGWLTEAPGALALTVISAVLAGHMAMRRSSELLLAETVVGEMHQLQITATAAAEQAHRLASHDPLTGLGNRRVLTDLIDSATKADETAGLILLDLDAFKAINDQYGHHYGDLVLLEVADRLQATLDARRAEGEPPVAVRLGGDEFAVFLKGADALEAHAIAERIHAGFGAPAEFGGVRVTIEASLGVGVAKGLDLGGLLQHADTEMYKAKRSGGGVLAAVAVASLGD